MSVLMDTPISVYRNARSTEPVTTKLSAFLNSQKFRQQVVYIRGIENKAERDAAKKQLPAATISGVFTKRAAEHIQKYNGLICLDFDPKENPGKSAQELKDHLSLFEEVAYCGFSVSGLGVFAIIPTNNTDPANHAIAVDMLGNILSQYDLYYDRSCKDVCRLRFVSYDDEPYINPNPRIFDAAALIRRYEAEQEAAHLRRPRPVIVPRTGGDHPGSTTEKKVERYVQAIEDSRIDVTGVYDDWMRIGMALASEFGRNGESFFLRISAFHPKFDAVECQRKYANFLATCKSVHIGTFFHIINQHNITIS
jgi:hypothetical protein